MTIKELKDLLDKFNDDDEVVISGTFAEDIADVYRSPFTGKVVITD